MAVYNAIKTLLKAIPGVDSLLEIDAWKSLRHSITLRIGERENSTFTGFLRLPSQYEALSGPVSDFLLSDGKKEHLIITVAGCSNGAEAYSIASALINHSPYLNFTVNAFDINHEMIKKAQSASYLHDEIFNNKRITDSFVETTFDREKNHYLIKEKIAVHVSFNVANVLDPNLKTLVGTSDIVFAQNFLLHMKQKMAKRAFKNIFLLLSHKSALFIDGMDIPMRQTLTKQYKLMPLEYKIEEIHNEARWARGIGWPYSYWGLEPFSNSKKDWQRRYSTIFLKT